MRSTAPAPDWKSAAALVLAAACWGLGGVMTKSVLAGVPPVTLLVVQLAASNLGLWSIVLAGRIRLPDRGEILRLGLTGVLNPGLAYTFSLIGLTFTSASLSALLWGTEPILILILAAVVLRERLSLPVIALAGLAGLGVTLMLGLNTAPAGPLAGLGSLLVFTGVACCAWYTILARRLAAGIEALALVAIQQAFALAWALAIWPVELALAGPRGPAALPPGPGTWTWAVLSGLIYYALAFWFYIAGLKKLPASAAGQYINLVPVFGVSGALLFLGEKLTPGQWLGGALILVAVTGIARWQSNTLTSPPGVPQ